MSHYLRCQVAIIPSNNFNGALRWFTHVEETGFYMAALGDHFVDCSNPQRNWLET